MKIMNKSKILFFIFAAFLFTNVAHAEMLILNPDTDQVTAFNTNVKDINLIKNINLTKFDIKVENISKQVSFWKVRAYCDKDMFIQLTSSSTNDCGKTVSVNLSKDNLYSFWLKNKDNLNKKFSVKLKGYDQNGHWIHSERERFIWK